VTYAKIQNVSTTNRILGRDSSGAGVIEEIAPADVVTMLGIEPNADVTDATNVAAAGALMDGDFTSNGFLKRTGAGSYTVDTSTFLTSLSVTGLSDINQLEQNLASITDDHAGLATAKAVKAYVDSIPGGVGGMSFILEDGDGTELTIANDKEIKFIPSSLLTINWTDTSDGSDSDPYDLTFTVDNDLANYDNSSSSFATTTALTNATAATAITGKALTNLGSGTGGNIAATDTILAAMQKLETRTALNDAKVTNTDVNVNVTNLTARLPQITENVTIGDASDVTVTMAGGLTVTGNLTVSGTTTTVNSNTVNIGDNIIVLNSDETGTPSQNAGIEVERGSASNKTLIWDESADKWTVGSENFTAATFTGDLTGDVTGNVSGNAGTATTLATARNIAGQSFDGSASITIATTDLSDISALDTDLSSVSASDDSLASAKAIKAYVDAQVDTADTFAEMADTNFTSPANGHLAIYNGDSSNWVNALPTGTDTSTIDMTITAGAGTLAISADLKDPNSLTEITDDGAGSTQTAAGVDQILVWEDDPGAFRKMTLANLSDFAVQNGAGGISAFKTIVVDTDTSTQIVADDTADTLSITSGTGMSIASTAGSDTLTFNVNIDSLTALGGTGLHQTQDHFMFSDNGTEKKITFSNLEDAIFGNVSGDIAIAAGGAATIQANSVALGTDTTGNYMTDVSAGTGIDVTHTAAEGSTATIAVDVSDFMSNGANNRILTATGTDAMNAESTFTYDGGGELTINVGTDGSNDLATIVGDGFGSDNDDTLFQLVAKNNADSVAAIGFKRESAADDAYIYFASQTTGTTSIDENMRITSDGNVGIGTTAPTVPLQVAGTLQAQQFRFNTNLRIGNPATNEMAIFTAGTERMRFDASGNVGIGTTSPSAKFSVENTLTYATGVLTMDVGSNSSNDVAQIVLDGHVTSGTNTISEILVKNANDSVSRILTGRDSANDAGFLTFATQATLGSLAERMRITGAGNVGIGTTSPEALLHVDTGSDSGTAILADGDIVVRRQSDNAEGIRLNAENNVGTHADILFHESAVIAAGNDMYFAIDSDASTTDAFFQWRKDGDQSDTGSALMTLTEAGNLGIGTTSPASKLDVRGTLTIDQSGASGTTGALAIKGSRTAGVEYAKIDFHNKDGDSGNFDYIGGSISVTNASDGANDGTMVFKTNNANAGLATALTIADDTKITTASDLTVGGNLIVSGSTTTVNTATMTVEDHNIVLGSGNGTGEVVDGAGLTLEGGSGDDITFQYNTTDNRMELKHGSSFEDFKAGTITGTLSGNASTATALATARNIHGVSFDGTSNIDLSEVIQDTVGAMFTGNTETNITATYQDGDGTIDLVVSTGAGGLTDLVSDTSPQLGGDLDVQTHEIKTTSSNRDIVLRPHGTGGVIVSDEGESFPSTPTPNKGKLTVVHDGGTGPTLLLTDSDGDAFSGPNLNLYRDSSSANADDILGKISWHGNNNNAEIVGYGSITSDIVSTADGSENGRMNFGVIASGTHTTMASITSAGLGIGTSSPSTELHVSGADHPSIRVTGTDNTNADPAIELLGTADNFTEGGQLWYDNGTGVLHLSSLYNNNAADIQFHTKTAADRSTSNVRMTIAGDGNVGIGTTSPVVPLHISRTLTGNDATTLVGAEVFRLDTIDDGSSSGGPGFSIRLESTNDHNSPNYEKVIMGDGGSMRVKNIHGNYGFSEWYLAGNADGKKPIMSITSGGSTSAGAAQDGILQLYSTTDAWAANTFSPTNNTTKVKLDAGGDSYFTGGNVGIGTTSPASLLHVGSTAYELSSGAYLTSSHQRTAKMVIHADDANTDWDEQEIGLALHNEDPTNNNWSPHIAFTTHEDDDGDPANANPVAVAAISATYNTRVANGWAKGDLVFFTNNAGSGNAERMRITSDGTLEHMKNTDAIAYHGRAAIGHSGHSDYAAFGHLDTFDTGGYALLQYADGRTFLNAEAGQSIRFRIHNNDKMILTNTGDVGIGTTAPDTLLHVSDDAEVSLSVDSSHATGSQISIDATGTGGHEWRLVSAANGATGITDDTGAFGLYSINGSSNGYKFVVEGTTGNVGIGTTSPAVPFHVAGGNNEAARFEGSGSDAFIKILEPTGSENVVLGSSFGTGFVGSASNNNFAIRANNSNKMFITPAGNVGIGTTPVIYSTNATTLQVHDATISELRLTTDNTGTATGNGSLIQSARAESTDNLYIWNAEAGKTIFATSATERMRIDASGNVGIGTTSPTHKLEVNGSFAATTKSFDIEHPTEEGKRLHHGSLEGPEHGVYIRGRLEGDVIELPDYWLGLVDEDTITVQLTPNKGFQQIYVDHIEDNKVYVGTQTDTPIDCFYFIQAERKDVEKMVVEY
jgi:hypothetical protein